MPCQVSLCSKILRSKLVSSLLAGCGSVDALSAITLLRKLCNHPALVASQMEQAIDSSAPLTPEETRQLASSNAEHSGEPL